MAGKRKSTNPSDDNGDGREASGQTQQAADVSRSPTDANPPPKLDRRREMADIARRRAAHFATWDDSTVGAEDEDGNGNGNGGENPHTGGSAARTLGPWSTAVELANARESQRAKREEGMITASRAATEQLGATPMGSIPPWTPSRSPLLGRRPMSQVPLLSTTCLHLVADLLEDVVGVSCSMHRRVAYVV
jgi:F-box/leucine-rich repeat protein 7